MTCVPGGRSFTGPLWFQRIFGPRPKTPFPNPDVSSSAAKPVEEYVAGEPGRVSIQAAQWIAPKLQQDETRAIVDSGRKELIQTLHIRGHGRWGWDEATGNQAPAIALEG